MWLKCGAPVDNLCVKNRLTAGFAGAAGGPETSAFQLTLADRSPYKPSIRRAVRSRVDVASPKLLTDSEEWPPIRLGGSCFVGFPECPGGRDSGPGLFDK
jgi:hypothetical protein